MTRTNEADIRHALLGEIEQRNDPHRETVVAVTAANYDEAEREVAEVLDALREQGEVYNPDGGSRLALTPSDRGAPHDDATLGVDVPNGTLQTVKGTVERQSGGEDDGATPEQLADVLPWPPERIAEGLQVLENRGEIYEAEDGYHVTRGEQA